MREAYKRELEAVGPDGLELARLTDRLKAGNRRRSGIMRPALIAAVLVVVLLGSVYATAAWQGWLDPVVSYGDNGALIEEYTVAVNETRKGARCDVTLENIITDGTAVYILFSAQYDRGFDLDSALEWGGLGLYPWGTGGMFRRIDDGSQRGTARFVGMCDGTSGESLLGQEIDVRVTFYELVAQETSDGGAVRYAHPGEEYYFEHVLLNDGIDLRTMEWEDGTRLTVSPLSAVLEFSGYYEDTANGLNVTLEFADGTRIEERDQGIAVKIQGAQINLGWSLIIGGAPGTENSFTMSRRFGQLVDPETVTALIIDGVRYEIN